MLGLVGGAVLALLAYGFFAWPRGGLSGDPAALARLSEPAFGGAGVHVYVRSADGRRIPVRLSGDGRLQPRLPVAPGTRMRVEAVFSHPGWIGWLAGKRQVKTIEVTAPRASVTQRWLHLAAHAPLRLRFDRPIRRLAVDGAGEPRLRTLPRPLRSVVVPRTSPAGSFTVSTAARTWERLSSPQSVTWFPSGRAPQLLVSPNPNSPIAPGAPLTLRFSTPVRGLLNGRLPTFARPVDGGWHTVDPHTLEFRPRGYGFGLETPIQLKLPTPVIRAGGSGTPVSALAWRTSPASQLRLQQLLAELGYLPLRWSASSQDAARTLPGQVDAALHPPNGSFAWRYPNIPAELRALWREGGPNQIVRGAVMAFEDTHGLDADGFAGARVWKALISDVIAGKGHDGGYSYVYVHLRVPQSLNLWHDGQVILSSPGNTGVPAAPTQQGTFQVFEHIPVGTMSGTNPDGSHYNDPGIRYISYFNGGDAIHAFNRASFGTPQSLGCVELPLAAAARVWPYTPIGTLVTVES